MDNDKGDENHYFGVYTAAEYLRNKDQRHPGEGGGIDRRSEHPLQNVQTKTNIGDLRSKWVLKWNICLIGTGAPVPADLGMQLELLLR